MASSATPALPPDLERLILETAAQQHPELTRIQLHAVIEPLLYHTLVISEWHSSHTLPLLDTMLSKPPEFFHKHVHNVIFWDTDRSEPNYGEEPGPDGFSELISLCTGVQNLALWDLVPSMVPALSALRPRRLTLPVHIFPGLGGPVMLPIFAAVTHLYLPDQGVVADSRLDADLQMLPCLTHLGVSGTLISRDLLCNLLNNCTKLQLLIKVHSDNPGPRDVSEDMPVPEITDPRFVVVIMNDVQYFEDWKAAASRGRDFWARAERLAKKRTGQEGSLQTLWCSDADEDDSD
ncbi:hypothetical protein C8J57DRAFT_1679187 [Mycena rebaudengoi]|nr:hypothetical protein C8J57DRAFT_1679187 [Mycena rebaudengoi]